MCFERAWSVICTDSPSYETLMTGIERQLTFIWAFSPCFYFTVPTKDVKFVKDSCFLKKFFALLHFRESLNASICFVVEPMVANEQVKGSVSYAI